MFGNITAIIPAYNEQAHIEKTIRALKDLRPVNQVIVVDDGSNDRTSDILSQISDIEVVKNNRNYGKGYSVKKALDHTRNGHVLLIDADLGESASEAEKMISALNRTDTVMIIGALPNPSVKGGIGIVKTLSRSSLYLLTAQDVPMLLSGQRLLPVHFIKSLDLPDRFGLEFKLTLEAIKKGVKIIEIPVDMQHRETANNIRGFWHRGRQCADILNVVRKEYRSLKH